MNRREYAAAREGAALVERSPGTRYRVSGRAPGRMLTGIVTGRIPPELVEAGPGIRKGEASPSAVLTPKGKIVTLLRLHRLGNGEEGGFLLDVPLAGAGPLREHLRRYLPPRFARVEDASDEVASFTLLGSGAPALLAHEVLGRRVEAPELEGLGEGEERILDDGSETGLRVVRTGEVDTVGFDLVGPADPLRGARERLLDAGAVPVERAIWDTLRIERGRPMFGVEVDDGVIPTEAGLDPRAIDHTKGCYTGQEVIVRIRDRGRVNRHLRGLLLGELAAPSPGTELFVEGRERPVGEIRSVAESPRFGQGAALGYVRREVEPPGVVRLGAPDGPPVQVRELRDDGWVLTEGDPG